MRGCPDPNSHFTPDAAPQIGQRTPIEFFRLYSCFMGTQFKTKQENKNVQFGTIVVGFWRMIGTG